jgi:3-oxoacyl-[acyl-carrier-protein] synthase-3
MPAYITATAACLPGLPVGNDDIERVLGSIGGQASRLKSRVLKNNGIRTRHYALDASGRPTHTTAQLAAEAARGALAAADVSLGALSLLTCGASVSDVVTPGIASLVHGELGGPSMEVASTHGVCTAGFTALKYAAMAVASGTPNAVAVGVERPSSFLHASHFAPELAARQVDEADPLIGFDQEFLRWMLSDGAGAALIEGTPRPGSLRIEWMDLVSYANELPTCMYMGGQRTADGGLRGWRDLGADVALRTGAFNLHQDVKVLDNIVSVCARSLEHVRARRRLTPDEVTWFLPHYSSEVFRGRTADELTRTGFPIPEERWASNLTTRGNTGAASILIMLADLLASGRVRAGDGILLMVPESGRFSCGWALLRAL